MDRFWYSKGVKFDSKNHNWAIFREYIALGSSYMSFAIKDSIEKETDNKNDEFDKTAYTYIFNKSTSFIDGNFVQTN